ncbi:hypothetical protein Bbelb_080470 [Branchiostoma belcheri]|nr:hypothetical protein Bbelb_080470 [Branchiostoma belcheri]
MCRAHLLTQQKNQLTRRRGPRYENILAARNRMNFISAVTSSIRVKQAAIVPARPRVGSPDGRRPEGDPIRGRAGTEGDAEYTGQAVRVKNPQAVLLVITRAGTPVSNVIAAQVGHKGQYKTSSENLPGSCRVPTGDRPEADADSQ